jgi:hypothetical protein
MSHFWDNAQLDITGGWFSEDNTPMLDTYTFDGASTVLPILTAQEVDMELATVPNAEPGLPILTAQEVETELATVDAATVLAELAAQPVLVVPKALAATVLAALTELADSTALAAMALAGLRRS